MLLLEGKSASEATLIRLESYVQEQQKLGRLAPHLAAVLVGNDGASETYVQNKVKTCRRIGFRSTLMRFPADISQDQLLAVIDGLNADPDIDGFIVQLPLPPHLNADLVVERISPAKDVDGFHPVNVGKLAKGLPTFVSATPLGIMLMMEHYQLSAAGKKVAVIGRSQIVGLPMALLLQQNTPLGNGTVTICHSKTPDLKSITQEADIIVAALGKPLFLTADMVKEGVVVIDVGITRIADPEKKSGYRIVGDVDFNAVAPKCSAITPVPGGVGLMTIAALMHNTMLAHQRR